MATVTELVETADTGNTPNASGSFTPTAGQLLVVAVVVSVSVSDADDVPTGSANGITFVRAVHGLYSGSANSVDLYVAEQLTPVAPSSMTVSWAPTDAGTGSVIWVGEISDMIRVGTDAIKQVANTDNGSAAGTPAVTFGAACVTGNPTVVAVGNNSSPAGVTEPSSWTETADTGYSNPTTGLEVAFRNSGFTGTTVTWGGTSASVFGAVAVELDASPPFRTNVHSQISADGHGTGSFVTSSFTPPDNSLLVVCVSMMRVSDSNDPSGAITCSGGGWTFTSRLAFGSTGQVFALGLRIFTAPVTTGASMAITAGSGGIDTQHYAVSVLAYTGYDTGSPTGATGTDFEAAAPDGAQSFNLSGAPATSSEVAAYWELDKDAAGTTPGTGWTEVYDLQTGSSGGQQTEVRTGSTSTAVAVVDTNTGGSIFKFIAGAIEIKVAAGGGAVEGTALGAFGYTGTATGVPTKLGVATGSFGFTGAAAGVPTKLGTAVGAFGYTGHANGIIPVDEITGTATGAFGYTGTAAGVPTKLGTAVGSFGYTGSAAGVPTKLGTAVGSFGFIGQAVGVPTKLGVGTGSFGYTGHASGQILGAVTGSALGVFGYTGQAVGVPTKLGVAVGTFGFVGQAAGTRIIFGVAVGAFGYIGEANGFVVGAIQPDPNPLRVVFAENLAPTTAESRQGVYTEGHHLVYQE